MSKPLRIGYIPEHFATPVHFAQKHFGLAADLIPEPYGTGALASRLKAHDPEKQLDVAIGLTEGFVSDLGKTRAADYDAGYGLAGTYVESPLCWAISTGAERSDVSDVKALQGKKVGVSRFGSGSHVMSFVFADQQGLMDDSSRGTAPFEAVRVGDFAALRQAVREKKADFFMWEHFTTKHYWDNGELKRLGEIYTPWPSWMVAARRTVDDQIEDVMEKLQKGIRYYEEQADEAVQHITKTMQYSDDDAREWMKTVRFANEVRGVDQSVVDSTINALVKAGVLAEGAGGGQDMIAIKR